MPSSALGWSFRVKVRFLETFRPRVVAFLGPNDR